MKKSIVDTYLLVSIFILFYWIPANIQVPFRVLILLLFNVYIYSKCSKKLKYISLFGIISLFVLFKLSHGTFDNSLLMVLLAVGPVFYFHEVSQNLTRINHNVLKVFLITSIIGVGLQLMIYSYEGRPRMSYEINHSGSYIFILFMFFDYIGSKMGRIIVGSLSVLLLSRLCLLCILLIFITRFLKKILLKESFRFSYFALIAIFAVIISAFSIWYTLNMKDEISTTSDKTERLKSVNDGSNYYRFMINSRVLMDIYEGNKQMLYEGYGDLAENTDYSFYFGSQPHNELIKHIAQYGLLFTLFLMIITSRYYSKLLVYKNLEYLVPIFLYSQILWVRFTIVPSLEMLSLFFLLTLNKNKIR